jgi:type IV pilus assembly protein PilO
MNLSELNELDFNNVGSWPVFARAVVILIVCAAVIFGVYWFDTRHQLDQLDQLKTKESKLKEDVKIRAAKAANLKEYQQQLEEMRQSFGEMRRQLPSKTEVAELLVDISQTGLAAGLEFELFQPQAEIKKDFYAELPITIRVTGTYHEFGEFVSGVAALPRIVTLHDISISRAGGDKLVMNATAKTYRYLEEEEIGQ